MYINNYKEEINKLNEPAKKAEVIKKFRDTKQNRVLLDQIFRFDASDEETTDELMIGQLREVVLCFTGIPKY
jgi:hypothetical protein